MAVWQFSFYLTENKDGVEPSVTSINHESLIRVAEILPVGESWLKNLQIYGDIDSTCLVLSYENQELQEISVRLDLRDLSKSVLTNVLSFIKSNKLRILLDNGENMEPTMETILRLIKNSDALKFCAEPSAYLLNLKQTNAFD